MLVKTLAGYNLYAARCLTLDALYSAIPVYVPMSQNGFSLPMARSFQFRGVLVLVELVACAVAKQRRQYLRFSQSRKRSSLSSVSDNCSFPYLVLFFSLLHSGSFPSTQVITISMLFSIFISFRSYTLTCYILFRFNTSM